MPSLFALRANIWHNNKEQGIPSRIPDINEYINDFFTALNIMCLKLMPLILNSL